MVFFERLLFLVFEKKFSFSGVGVTFIWMILCIWESCGLFKLAMSWRGFGRIGTNVWRSVIVLLFLMFLWVEIGLWVWGDWGWSGE